MQKRKKPFERIPLSEVPVVRDSDASPRRTPAKSAKANVQKRAARPKRSINAQEDDHPVGLWIDVDLLRKHRNRSPQIVLHDQSSASSHYLMLADFALRNKGNSKEK